MRVERWNVRAVHDVLRRLLHDWGGVHFVLLRSELRGLRRGPFVSVVRRRVLRIHQRELHLILPRSELKRLRRGPFVSVVPRHRWVLRRQRPSLSDVVRVGKLERRV